MSHILHEQLAKHEADYLMERKNTFRDHTNAVTKHIGVYTRLVNFLHRIESVTVQTEFPPQDFHVLNERYQHYTTKNASRP